MQSVLAFMYANFQTKCELLSRRRKSPSIFLYGH